MRTQRSRSRQCNPEPAIATNRFWCREASARVLRQTRRPIPVVRMPKFAGRGAAGPARLRNRAERLQVLVHPPEAGEAAPEAAGLEEEALADEVAAGSATVRAAASVAADAV